MMMVALQLVSILFLLLLSLLRLPNCFSKMLKNMMKYNAQPYSALQVSEHLLLLLHFYSRRGVPSLRLPST